MRVLGPVDCIYPAYHAPAVPCLGGMSAVVLSASWGCSREIAMFWMPFHAFSGVHRSTAWAWSREPIEKLFRIQSTLRLFWAGQVPGTGGPCAACAAAGSDADGDAPPPGAAWQLLGLQGGGRRRGAPFRLQGIS